MSRCIDSPQSEAKDRAVLYSNRGNSLELDGDKAILTVREESTAEQRGRFVNEWYREILKAEIERVLPKWE